MFRPAQFLSCDPYSSIDPYLAMPNGMDSEYNKYYYLLEPSTVRLLRFLEMNEPLLSNLIAISALPQDEFTNLIYPYQEMMNHKSLTEKVKDFFTIQDEFIPPDIRRVLTNNSLTIEQINNMNTLSKLPTMSVCDLLNSMSVASYARGRVKKDVRKS